MSDKTPAAPNLVAGQPLGTGEQQQFLTRAEYDAGQTKLLEELKKSNVGLAGSLGENQGKRIATDIRGEIKTAFKQLEDTLKAQKAVGIEVTPAQEEAMRQHVMQDVLTKEPIEAEPQILVRGQAPAQAPDLAPDPITEAAWSEMKKRGIDILEEDPEFAILDSSSPYKFLLSVDKAIAAKETRLQNEPPPTEPNQTGPNPIARIPGAGAGGQSNQLLPQGTPPLERLSSFYKKQGI